MDFFDGKNVDVLSPDYIAAVYLRLSKEDGDLSGDVDKLESNSIQNQKTLILNYLSQFPNVKVYDVYSDDGYSGTDFVEVR